jgi:hypothetical protein
MQRMFDEAVRDDYGMVQAGGCAAGLGMGSSASDSEATSMY